MGHLETTTPNSSLEFLCTPLPRKFQCFILQFISTAEVTLLGRDEIG